MSHQIKRSEFVCYHGALHDRDWPLGAPGRFPVAWLLIWPTALCFILIIIIIIIINFFFFFFAFPMCQSDHFRLWHSLING